MADELVKELTFREVASRAGLASARSLTPEQRKQRARRAAQARWHKKAESPPPDGPNDPQDRVRRGEGAEAGIMLSSRVPPQSVTAERTPRSRRAAAA